MLPRVVSITMLPCLYQPTNLCALSEIKTKQNKTQESNVAFLYRFSDLHVYLIISH